MYSAEVVRKLDGSESRTDARLQRGLSGEWRRGRGVCLSSQEWWELSLTGETRTAHIRSQCWARMRRCCGSCCRGFASKVVLHRAMRAIRGCSSSVGLVVTVHVLIFFVLIGEVTSHLKRWRLVAVLQLIHTALQISDIFDSSLENGEFMHLDTFTSRNHVFEHTELFVHL